MFQLTRVLLMERSVITVFYISLILLVRKYINKHSFRYATVILWGLVMLRLICPYSILWKLPEPAAMGGYHEYGRDFIGWLHWKEIQFQAINVVFPRINRFVIMMGLAIYITEKFFKAIRDLRGSVPITFDPRVDAYLKQIPLQRKVTVLVNDNIRAPITYGIFRPKIILQSRILTNDNLLKYILLHEMTHIRKWDALWNYIKYIVACISWFNPFVWMMVFYLDEDIEILCDKLVMKEVGETDENKKQYSIAMLELMTEQTGSPKKIIGLHLHPNVERMILLKNWKLRKSGLATFALILCLFGAAFVYAEEDRIPTTVVIGGLIENSVINVNDRTRELSQEEYERYYQNSVTEMNAEPDPRSVDLEESNTLASLQSKVYSFNMNSFIGSDHDKLVTSVYNTASSGTIHYIILIQENGDTIYSNDFSGDQSIVTSGLKSNKNYSVTILNLDSKKLSYQIKIKSSKN